MFENARIKLTAWYLAIIMMVSVSFSIFIYKSISAEFERRLNAIEARLEMGRFGAPPPGQVEMFLNDLEDAREKVLIILFYTNLVILFFSSVAGYFLAGRTLSPIEKTMEDQKRFIADASHELRTPLTSLKTEVEVALRDKKLKLSEARELLKSNLQEVDKIKGFSDYLLSLSRYETSGGRIKMEKVDVSEAVSMAVERNRSLAKNKKIKIVKNLQKVVVKGNPQSLVELISILVNNAIKYSYKNKKVIVDVSKTGRSVKITVSDEGIGISKNDLPHVFDRFYRADISRSKKEIDGYGLGLSIAKSITDLHKGKISVQSKIGKGSIFKIMIPL